MSIFSTTINESNNLRKLTAILTITFYDRMRVQFPLRLAKACGWFLGKSPCFQQLIKPDSTNSMMHRVWSKGTALRAVGRKPRVGSNPTHANTSNVNIQQLIKTLRLKIFRH